MAPRRWRRRKHDTPPHCARLVFHRVRPPPGLRRSTSCDHGFGGRGVGNDRPRTRRTRSRESQLGRRHPLRRARRRSNQVHPGSGRPQSFDRDPAPASGTDGRYKDCGEADRRYGQLRVSGDLAPRKHGGSSDARKQPRPLERGSLLVRHWENGRVYLPPGGGLLEPPPERSPAPLATRNAEAIIAPAAKTLLGTEVLLVSAVSMSCEGIVISSDS